MMSFVSKKAKDEKIAKEVILKRMFNSAAHKKMVVNAVKKSSEDQQKLIKKYDKQFSH